MCKKKPGKRRSSVRKSKSKRGPGRPRKSSTVKSKSCRYGVRKNGTCKKKPGKKTNKKKSGMSSNSKTKRKTSKRKSSKSKTPKKRRWSKKYKDSIDCKHPKGFSQRAHCKSIKKKSSMSDGINRWFKEKWIDVCQLPKKVPCGRKKGTLKNKKTYPYCRPSVKVNNKTPKLASQLTKEEIKKRCKRKKKDPRTRIMPKKKSKKKSSMSSNPKTKRKTSKRKSKTSKRKIPKGKKSVPTDPKLYAKIKKKIKNKVDVWPSAYASGQLVKAYKKAGGKYKYV